MQISQLSHDDSRINLPAILIVLPIIANLFSRNMAEYLFDLLVLAVFFWSFRGSYGFTWRSFRLPSAFDYIWPFLVGTIIFSHLLNKTLNWHQLTEIMQYLWILGLYCLARALSEAKFPKWFFKFVCIFLIILSALLIFDFFRNPPETSSTWGLPNRLRGTFTNTNFLAHSYYVVFVFLFAQFISHLEKKGFDKFFALLATVAIAVTLFLTFNRSIWFTSIAVIPLLAYQSRKWAAPLALSILAALFLVLFTSDIGGFRTRIQSTISSEHSSDIARVNLWKANLYMFQQHPIFGIGYNNNIQEVKKYYDLLGISGNTEITHSHNQILSFLVGSGILGTLLYVSLFIVFGFLAWRTIPLMPKEYPIRRGLIIGALVLQPGFLLAGIADNNFDIHVARCFLVVSWAITLHLATEFLKNSPSPTS